MARIRSISAGHQNVRVHPTEVDCTFQQVHGKDGTKYVQLTTYGSDTRKSGTKSSQIIQIDKAAAHQLIQILREHFDRSE